jgi:dihydrolipoamide dehydrogenase
VIDNFERLNMPGKGEPGEIGSRVEVVVIGGGPGGYPAAFDAADRGMDVAIVNDEAIPGGVCLHRGCIPSKALLHVARLLGEAHDAPQWGITFSKPKIDLDKLRTFKSSVVTKLTGGVSELCKARGVKLVQARARFLDSTTLELKKPDGSTQKLAFGRAIIATGSSPVVPPIFAIKDPRVMDSTGALDLPDIPDRLLVVGGGYIGLEMGSVYAALGSKVTVVEMTAGLLPGADRDLVRPLKARLDKLFAGILLNTKVVKLTSTKDGIVAELEGEGAEPKQTFDRVLVSVGRRPNSRDLGLETTRVEVDEKGFIKVDAQRRTADPNILAIGDVAGEPMLAHKATREAHVAIEALAGEPAAFDNLAIPAVVFTDPEIAWCGLTETEAKNTNREVQVTRFPWAASGRAQTISRTEGLTKILFDPQSQRVLGVGIVGAGAGELIAEGTLAVETACVARDVAETIHAHPTLSETLMEAAEMAFGQATHIYRAKRSEPRREEAG